ncbi:SipW-dependent-type signal peptide-containing protein [Cellulomonas denverensis]|uniref:Alternate-type signal peptide domain-containing protein n=1 Tax=Cellulomonas denverensis TaxID=264297 RepID=A0A7X6KVJ7_9CELL|nr:SipW-dependent-type signal peptide-containing protein [Cellulomonas denverensis]NKY23097.1 hypothetical protein [Cellulomonas denverensis]GIG23822.1 hypothetical protein Cde04nite_00660 [Cellulomonas denverensis]
MTAGRRRGVLFGLSAVVAAVLLIGGTFALWSARTGFAGGTITSGDLSLELTEATWAQVTPGVTNLASGRYDDGLPADFHTMPGDVIEISQPVTTTLVGENIAGGFSVAVAEGAAGDVEAGRIVVTFSVRDDGGNTVAPQNGAAELGTTVVVPGLTGSEDAAPQDWTVVVRVEVRGEYVWTGEPVTDATGAWTLGEIRVGLEQVREGEGYATGGAA